MSAIFNRSNNRALPLSIFNFNGEEVGASFMSLVHKNPYLDARDIPSSYTLANSVIKEFRYGLLEALIQDYVAFYSTYLSTIKFADMAVRVLEVTFDYDPVIKAWVEQLFPRGFKGFQGDLKNVLKQVGSIPQNLKQRPPAGNSLPNTTDYLNATLEDVLDCVVSDKEDGYLPDAFNEDTIDERLDGLVEIAVECYDGDFTPESIEQYVKDFVVWYNNAFSPSIREQITPDETQMNRMVGALKDKLMAMYSFGGRDLTDEILDIASSTSDGYSDEADEE